MGLTWEHWQSEETETGHSPYQPAPGRVTGPVLTAILAAAAAVLMLVLVVVVALATGLARIDHTAGATGVSAGTDLHYCSAEVMHWSVDLSCEAAS